MISVIVPVYNTAEYLERVVQALRDQDYPVNEYELIFVDNGSTDGSLHILKECNITKVHRETIRGSYAARNLGIQHARGDILAFTDSDCFPHRSWLLAIDTAFNDNQVQIVMGPRLPRSGNNSLDLLTDYENAKAQLVFSSSDPLVYFGYTNNMAVRKSVMDRYGPFVHRARGSDTLFVRLVVDNISPDAVRYCPDMSVLHAELDSLGNYYEKLRIYGTSRTAYGNVTRVRSLSLTERWSTFRQVSRKRRVGEGMMLFILLCMGVLNWATGRLIGSQS